jgi:peptidoglycan/xylan/chitin deacetylase (PgdA/CDA1 family)
MRTPGLTKVKRLSKRVVKRFGRRALILMYHRVAAKDLDPWSLCVTPAHFAEQLEVLRQHTQPIGLGALAQAHRAGRLPDGAAAVTFDDGYANNLHQAKPLLERHAQPATVFVTTGYVGRGREFWWDELDRIVLTPGPLPELLRLDLGDAIRTWELRAAVAYSADEYRADSDEARRDAHPTARLSLYHTLWKALQPLAADCRQRALDALRSWAQAGGTMRESHRPMELRELALLEAGGLVDIGAHTASHPLLPAHPLSFQRNEIQESKTYLERVLGHPVTTFAYPFGAYSRDTVPLLREAGFAGACACSTPETVWWGSHPLELPRFEVRDWAGDEFERRLVRWLKS